MLERIASQNAHDEREDQEKQSFRNRLLQDRIAEMSKKEDKPREEPKKQYKQKSISTSKKGFYRGAYNYGGN